MTAPTTLPAPLSHADQLNLLLALTQIPTAAGREDGVIAFIRVWAAARPDIKLTTDAAGNLTLAMVPRNRSERKRRGRDDFDESKRRPLYITAHLDHPAFVVESVDKGSATLSFRGGVMDVFFEHAPITIHPRATPDSAGTDGSTMPGGAGPPAFGPGINATLTGEVALDPPSPLGKHYTADLDGDPAQIALIAPGDIATWRLPVAAIDERGLAHTPACDDLAAAAAALCAFDQLRRRHALGKKMEEVRLLFTRSEEIGFIGAIAACRLRTMPAGSRVIALENSRSFPESPLGGGPIVRVGDRLSIFTPWLSAACCARAEEAFGGASAPKASQTHDQGPRRPWQRKLMAGGACEASAFCQAGYDATCICLPLGNYHNMPHLDALQSGRYDATTLGPPRCAPEFIHKDDFLGLIDLLVAIGINLPRPDGKAFGDRLDKMYEERKGVLGPFTEPPQAASPRTGPRHPRPKTSGRRQAKRQGRASRRGT